MVSAVNAEPDGVPIGIAGAGLEAVLDGQKRVLKSRANVDAAVHKDAGVERERYAELDLVAELGIRGAGAIRAQTTSGEHDAGADTHGDSRHRFEGILGAPGAGTDDSPAQQPEPYRGACAGASTTQADKHCGVAGYQPFEGSITAGTDLMKSFDLTAVVSEPLRALTMAPITCATATSSSATSGSVVPSRFSRPIELAASTYTGGAAEQLDDTFLMVSTNTDMDTNFNALAADGSSAARERATSLTVSGDTLTLSWNPSVGLTTKDPDDVITETRYSLTGIDIQPVGRPDQRTSVSSLIGTTQISCN